MNPRKLPRILILTAGYALLLNASLVAALLLRFDGDVPARIWSGCRWIAAPYTLISLGAYLAAGLYHDLWRYAGTASLFQILRGVSLSAGVLAAVYFVPPARPFPASVIALAWLCQLVGLGGARLAWRLLREGALGGARERALPGLVVGA